MFQHCSPMHEVQSVTAGEDDDQTLSKQDAHRET